MSWIGIIIIIIAIAIGSIVECKYKIKYPITWFLIFSSAVGGILILGGENEKNPSALDVYRHNTTLKVTYINNVPTDTVVIFKDIK